MKSKILCTAAMAALALGVSAIPAQAQNAPADPGLYVDIGWIDIADGGDIQYLNYLATEWRKNQEFAKSKGWIVDYAVFANVNPRPGEPDLYLSTTFASMPDAAESLRRQDAWREHMKKSDAQMSAESGDRSKFRTVMGSMLLQQVILKK